MYDVFISYSRKDLEIVLQYVDFLERHGLNVWIDRKGIYSGDKFKGLITQAIIDSDMVLFFSSANSNASSWVEKEISVAVHMNKAIIPIKLDSSNYNVEFLMDLVDLDFVLYNGSVEATGDMILKSIMHNRQSIAPNVVMLGAPNSGKTTLALYLSRLTPANGMKVVGNYNATMNYEIENAESIINGKSRNVWQKRIELWDYKNVTLIDFGPLEHDVPQVLSILKPDCAILVASYERNDDTWEYEIDNQELEYNISLAKECGIKKIIPLINKMDMNDDEESMKRSQEFFNATLTKYGYPVCAEGMNGSALGAINGVPEWEYKLEYIVTELGKI